MVAANNDGGNAGDFESAHLLDEENEGLHRWAAVMEDVARVQDEIDVARRDDLVYRRREGVLDIDGALIAPAFGAEAGQGAEAEVRVTNMGNADRAVTHRSDTCSLNAILANRVTEELPRGGPPAGPVRGAHPLDDGIALCARQIVLTENRLDLRERGCREAAALR